jgi:hypothetical protein
VTVVEETALAATIESPNLQNVVVEESGKLEPDIVTKVPPE